MQPTLDAPFAALSDRTRRAILDRLRQGDATVSELARLACISLPGLLKHLRVLEGAGLVETRKHGRTRHVRLRAVALREATDLLDSYRMLWAERFDVMAPYIDLSDMDVT